MTKKKKAYVVFPRHEGPLKTGLKLGDRTVEFKEGTIAKTIYDPAVAAEIDRTYGMNGGSGDVWVSEDEKTSHIMTYHPDPVHRYFFAPTQAYRENYDRIFRKGKENAR